jgi:hypothetical protein
MREERNKIIGCDNNLGFDLDDAVVFRNNLGYCTVGLYCDVPLGGAICFEASFDNVHWEGINLRSLEQDIYMQNTSSSGNFIGSIIGARSIRVRTCAPGSIKGTIRGVMDQSVSVLEGIEFGYPPHRFGFTQVHKDIALTETTAGATLWAPASGKRFVVTDIAIVASGTTDATLCIFEDVDIQGNRLFRSPIEVVTNKQFAFAHAFKTPFRADNIDKILKVTTSGNLVVSISVHGYEV